MPITVPSVIGSDVLKWFNDTIVTTAPLDDPVAVEDEIFDRRAGDLFIQASRAEIISLLPEVKIPGHRAVSRRVRDLAGGLRQRRGAVARSRGHLRHLVF